MHSRPGWSYSGPPKVPCKLEKLPLRLKLNGVTSSELGLGNGLVGVTAVCRLAVIQSLLFWLLKAGFKLSSGTDFDNSEIASPLNYISVQAVVARKIPEQVLAQTIPGAR